MFPIRKYIFIDYNLKTKKNDDHVFNGKISKYCVNDYEVINKTFKNALNTNYLTIDKTQETFLEECEINFFCDIILLNAINS